MTAATGLVTAALTLVLLSTGISACSTDEAGVLAPVVARADGGADAPSGADAASVEPAVRVVGRTDERDPAGPRFGWPGTRVVARFSGTGADIRLSESPSGSDGTSMYDVLVDGATRTSPLVLTQGPATYSLAAGLSSGEHVVELRRRTEGRVGTTQLLGFTPNGSLLSPPPALGRRIEFVGDSETNGYGIEGIAPCSFSAATQNEGKAYPALVAKELAAERATISFSGKGVLRNPDRSDAIVFGQLYARAVPVDADSPWAFERFAADVVVVAVGGNDWERPDPAVFDPPDTTQLRGAYDALLTDIRKAYPSARIFCALPASLTPDHPVGYDAYAKMKALLQGVVDARTAGGDARIHYFEFPRATEADRTGCDYHYGPAFHQMLAASLAPAIREKTGW